MVDGDGATAACQQPAQEDPTAAADFEHEVGPLWRQVPERQVKASRVAEGEAIKQVAKKATRPSRNAIDIARAAGQPDDQPGNHQFETTTEVRASLLVWLQGRGGTVGDYAFTSRVDHTDYLSTRQYARLVDEWVTVIGLRREDYGTHSLRRIKAAMIYKAILLGHTKIENTVRYLGVDIEDALERAEQTET